MGKCPTSGLRAGQKDCHCKLCEHTRELQAKYKTAYRNEHREKCRANGRTYYLKHREKCRANGRTYYLKHREKCRAYMRQYYHEHYPDPEKWNPQKMLAYLKRYRKSLRAQVFDIYGAKCSCCGEASKEFLTLHHVNKDGSKDRSQRNSLAIMKKAIEKKNRTKFAILCYNCHMAIHHNDGICPHHPKA